MDLRELGHTGSPITPVGLGCMQFAGGGLVDRIYPAVTSETVTSVVRAAVEGGITWFDTAEMYGRGGSERALTTALRASGVEPGRVTIATKWSPGLRRAGSIGRTIGDRLTNLQGYPIDLHQVHMPYGGFSRLEAQVRAMAELQKAGRVAAVGVSNFSASQMEMASRVLASYGLSLTSNQVQISLLHRAIERNGVLDAARRLGVTLIAYTPLASGVLSGVFHDDPAKARSAPLLRRAFAGLRPKALARTRPLVEELREIGRANGGATASQVALAWVTGYYGDAVVAIPGASKPWQAREAAASMTLELSSDELNRLADVAERTRR